MINNCRENAFVNKRLRAKTAVAYIYMKNSRLSYRCSNIKTHYFRMFLCYLIVDNQYIHLLFPDL